MLGAPGRSGPAHIMLLRPVGAHGVAGHLVPENRQEMAHCGKGRRRRSGNDCNRSTHDTSLRLKAVVPPIPCSPLPTPRFTPPHIAERCLKNRCFAPNRPAKFGFNLSKNLPAVRVSGTATHRDGYRPILLQSNAGPMSHLPSGRKFTCEAMPLKPDAAASFGNTLR